MATTASPARRQEVDETAELAKTIDDLNNRLNVILLAHRSADANSSHGLRARDETLQTLERQLELARQAYQEQLQRIQKQRDTDKEQRLIAEGNLTDLQRKYALLKKQLEEAELRNEKLDAQVSQLQDELAEANAALLQVKSSNENLLVQTGNLKKKVASLEAQLADALRAADSNTDQVNYWKAKAQTAEQAADNLRDDLDQISSRLEKELVLLRGSSEGLENRLRSEFARQLTDIVNERQQLYDQEKNELLEEQRQMYEEKIRQIHADYNSRSDEMSSVIDRNAELETSQKLLAEKVVEQGEQIKALENTISHQKKLLDDIRHHPNRGIGKKDQEIRELREQLEEQGRLMRELEEARIRLDREIETYRTLLQEEENRLKHQPTALMTSSTSPVTLSHKRRKVETTTTTGAGSVARSTVTTTISSPHRQVYPLRIIDSVGANQLAVLNQSQDDVDLDGWVLSIDEADVEQSLPNRSLAPGDRLVVQYGTNPTQEEDDGSLYIYLPHAPRGGLSIKLITPNNVVADSFAVRRFVQVNGSDKKECIVM